MKDMSCFFFLHSFGFIRFFLLFLSSWSCFFFFFFMCLRDCFSFLVKMSTPKNNRPLINIKISRGFIQMFFSFGNFPSKSMTAPSPQLCYRPMSSQMTLIPCLVPTALNSQYWSFSRTISRIKLGGWVSDLGPPLLWGCIAIAYLG